MYSVKLVSGHFKLQIYGFSACGAIFHEKFFTIGYTVGEMLMPIG
jgi:hypothetical protein